MFVVMDGEGWDSVPVVFVVPGEMVLGPLTVALVDIKDMHNDTVRYLQVL